MIYSKLVGAIVKKIAFILLFSIAMVTFVKGQAHRFVFSTGVTLNVNDFNWSIAGNSLGNTPNILSELTFNKITSVGYFLEGRFKAVKYLELSGYYQRNSVVNGEGTDTDYSGDNRSNPTFHQPFSSNGGHVKIFRAGARYDFLHRVNFSLGAGVSYRSTLQDFVILSEQLTDLRSTYRAQWRGPAVSVAGKYQLTQRFSVDACLTYFFIRYNAEANWNLIDIFEHPLSFAQRSNGQGTDFSLKFSHRLNSCLSFSLDGLVGKAEALKGIDTSYLRNGTQVSTRFNGSNNDYDGFKLGATLLF